MHSPTSGHSSNDMPTQPTRSQTIVAAMSAALAVLPCLAMAQTIPIEDIHRTKISQCRIEAVNRPSDALRLADSLLADPTLTAGTEALAHACRAQAYYTLGDQPRTRGALDRLQGLIDSPGMTSEARVDAKLVLSSALTMSGDPEQGLEILESVLDEVAARGDRRAESMALRGIAFVHAAQLDDPEGALPYFERAITALEDAAIPLLPQDGMLHYNHAYTLLRLDRIEEADVAYRKVEAIAATLPGQDQLLRRVASNRAEIALARGDAATAIDRLQPTIAWQQQNGDAQGATESRLVLARALMSQGRHRDALAMAEVALEAAQNGAFLPEARRSLDLLVDISRALGDQSAATAYAVRARALDGTATSDGAVSRLESLRASTERGDRSEVVNRVNAASRERLSRVAMLAAVALALVLGSLALWRRLHRRRMAAPVEQADPLMRLPRLGDRVRLAEAADRPSGKPSALLLVELDRQSDIGIPDHDPRAIAMLAHITETLRHACDEQDILMRWTSMQFVVLRRNTTHESAFALAGQLRSRFASAPVPHDTRLRTTISIGVASLPFSRRKSAEAILADAIRVAEYALSASRRQGPGGWTGFWTDSPATDDPDALLEDVDAALSSGRVVCGSNWSGWSPLRNS